MIGHKYSRQFACQQLLVVSMYYWSLKSIQRADYCHSSIHLICFQQLLESFDSGHSPLQAERRHEDDCLSTEESLGVH